MGGDFVRAEALVVTAEQAQAALGTRLPSVARVRAILAFYTGDLDEAQHRADDWVELARASGDAYELADALTMLASALQFTEPTLDAAIATVDEAVRVARGAGIDSALSVALGLLASWLPDEESQRALALLDEALEVGTRIGDRQSVSTAMLKKAGLAARRGDWRTALRACVDSAEQKLELGDLVLLRGSLYMAGVALCALGSSEPAAVLYGKADTMTRPTPNWVLDMVAATGAALLETLGEPQVARLAERGAALDMADAVAYLHAEANQALRQDWRA
jgi:tetratricopeptide (TPR) repeat protein